MYLRSKPFLRTLTDPFGRAPRVFELRADGIAITGGRQTWLGFAELSAPPSMRKGWFGTRITLVPHGAPPLVLRTANRLASLTFATATEKAWRTHSLAQLAAETDRIDRIAQALDALQSPRRYPAVCDLAGLWSDVAALNTALLSKLAPESLAPETEARLAPIRAFAADPEGARSAAAERFVAAELARYQDFLDTIETQPLTPEQRLAVVVDEDATLVLAGAGSGKTSVITAKAAYLIKAGLRRPEEILLLAFARDAATEMSQRITSRAGVAVEARTFHALGMQIIGAVEGQKPALAPHASDDMAYLALLREILRELVTGAAEIAAMIIGWFAHAFDDPRSDWDFQTKHEWYREVERLDLRTLQGESVASFEELQIANWLYRNGIAYDYEPLYEHPLPGTGTFPLARPAASACRAPFPVARKGSARTAVPRIPHAPAARTAGSCRERANSDRSSAACATPIVPGKRRRSDRVIGQSRGGAIHDDIACSSACPEIGCGSSRTQGDARSTPHRTIVLLLPKPAGREPWHGSRLRPTGWRDRRGSSVSDGKAWPEDRQYGSERSRRFGVHLAGQ